MKLYLDIDGVLLGKRGTIPDGLEEFLKFAVANFDCHWLTTHCKGDARTALRYLANYLPEQMMDVLKTLKPTNWDAMKTEGIDFTEPFIWLDDQPFEAELQMLAKQGCEGSLIVVDLNNLGELERIENLLETKSQRN